jgi:hypothetical protein
MQRHCAYSMHKVHRDYKNEEQRRDQYYLLRAIQVYRRRQCVAAKIHRRGMVH